MVSFSRTQKQAHSMSAEAYSTTLPRWVYIALSIITAAIGVAACGVTAKFFILGLERLEPDPAARSILVATGMLMIATEMACFGLAALLPATKLRSLRVKLIATGSLLLCFEAATIYAAQGALDQASESAASATTQRIGELQATIQARRAAAESLRANGTQQSASSNSWTRTLGAASLRDALKVEAEIDPLARELSHLQGAVRPTSASVLGTQGMMAYGLARGLLISTMGLVMFGAAGALLREALTRSTAPVPDAAVDPVGLPEVAAGRAPSAPVSAPKASASAAPSPASETAGWDRGRDGWIKALENIPGAFVTRAPAEPVRG